MRSNQLSYPASRIMLLKNVWDDEFIGEGTLAVHIRHLREKMEKDPKDPKIIKTIWGVGYIIEELYE